VTKKAYPLDIQDIREFEGGPRPIWYTSKGHHDATVFCEELQRVYGIHVEPSEVRQGWQRTVPSGPDYPGWVAVWPARAGARGAYPITVVEIP